MNPWLNQLQVRFIHSIMPASARPDNHILRVIPPADWEKLRPHLRSVSLMQGDVLAELDEGLTQVYFPEGGVVSAVSLFEDGTAVEMATTGWEGMVPASACLGADRAIARYVVQVPGSGHAMELRAFKEAMEALPSFRTALMNYAQAFLAQVFQSVACNGIHSVEERCARWLLMTRDRVETDTFRLTQEFLAEMLGVSRPAVSIVARTLQTAGLIRYSRGAVTILDRSGLEEATCECYRIIRRQYERRLPGSFG